MTPLIPVLLALLAVQTPGEGTAVVEGTIMRAASVQPIQSARVIVWGDQGPDFGTVTDANGHYAIPLPAGTFNIEISADGYVSEPRPWLNTTIRLVLADKQRLLHNVSMTPVGAIQGRILDDKREPLARITVEILQLGHDTQGRSVWAPVAASTTDEKGEYRFEDLSPDEYYIRASRKPIREAAGGSRVDVAATYFPGTSDVVSAATIRLRDADVTAEFSLADARTYAVAGKISKPDQKKVESTITLFAVPQDPRIPLDRRRTAGFPVEASADGEWDFEIQGLLPGVYDLFAVAETRSNVEFTITVADETLIQAQQTFERIRGRVAATTLQIRDEDMKDVRLSLDPGVDVKGLVEVIDNLGKPFPFEIRRGTPVPLHAELTKPQLVLSLDHQQDYVSPFLHLEPAQQESSEPNTFVIEAVPAGTYNVGIQALGVSKDFYVADIRAGARSVFDDGLTVSKTDVGVLEVVVGLNGGRIDGTVAGGKNFPVVVVLAPDSARRQNGALFKTNVLDKASDAFDFAGVAPGLYSLFAFEVSSTADIVPYRNADFLALHETKGMRVTIEKNSVVGPVRLQIIPRQQ